VDAPSYRDFDRAKGTRVACMNGGGPTEGRLFVVARMKKGAPFVDAPFSCFALTEGTPTRRDGLFVVARMKKGAPFADAPFSCLALRGGAHGGTPLQLFLEGAYVSCQFLDVIVG
jgi:hypothetical protein